MKLYCVRHGHAKTTHENPLLSDKGIREVQETATYLKTRKLTLAHLFHSEKMRAQKTARLLADALNQEPTLLPQVLLGDHAVLPLTELIQSWHDDTMLVGHMPLLSKLVSKLVLENEHQLILQFPPATVVCLEREQNNWTVEWILPPDLVNNPSR